MNKEQLNQIRILCGVIFNQDESSIRRELSQLKTMIDLYFLGLKSKALK